MIRNGKALGWLQLPTEALLPWALLNDVVFQHVVPGVAEGKGAGLLATEALPIMQDPDEAQILMTVPQDLILSLERVHEHAKTDKDFREVLESLGEFGRTPRGAILTFLLVQISVSCPVLSERVGVHGSFTDYVKSLPCELLPIFWTSSELELLVGTTLAPAVSSKIKSLEREFDLLCESAAETRWYKIVKNHLDFDDWMQVDAMYRSRALDFPGIGHCMVPCIDLANHSAGEDTIAIYEKDSDGNAVLLLRDGKTVKEGEEITITYGDEKGACEMLFSYGFLEHDRTSAETLFLSLSIPDDDPYRLPKVSVADAAPGVKLIDAGNGRIDWTGDFIWLLCVTHDDGLRFEIARTVDGASEMHAFFDGHRLMGGASQLHAFLEESDLWDVYRLRAVVTLQQRVFDQLQILHSTQEEVEVRHGDYADVRDRPYEQAMHLRRLEFELMERAYEDFEHQKDELAKSETVRRYLAQIGDEQQTTRVDEEDFS